MVALPSGGGSPAHRSKAPGVLFQGQAERATIRDRTASPSGLCAYKPHDPSESGNYERGWLLR